MKRLLTVMFVAALFSLLIVPATAYAAESWAAADHIGYLGSGSARSVCYVQAGHNIVIGGPYKFLAASWSDNKAFTTIKAKATLYKSPKTSTSWSAVGSSTSTGSSVKSVRATYTYSVLPTDFGRFNYKCVAWGSFTYGGKTISGTSAYPKYWYN